MEAKVRVKNAEFVIDGEGKITGLCGKIEELRVAGRRLPVRDTVAKDLSDIPKIVKLLSDLNQFLALLPDDDEVKEEEEQKKKEKKSVAEKKKPFHKPKVNIPKKKPGSKPRGNRIAKVRDCYIYDEICSSIMNFVSGGKAKSAEVDLMIKDVFGYGASAAHYHVIYLIETGFVYRGTKKSGGRGWLIKKGRTSQQIADGDGTFPNLLTDDGKKAKLKKEFDFKARKRRKGK